jgi:Fe-S cluster biogenesis protein NfuA
MSAVDIFIIALVFIAVVLVIRSRIKLQAAGGCSGCSNGSCATSRAGKSSCRSCCSPDPELQKRMEDAAAKAARR